MSARIVNVAEALIDAIDGGEMVRLKEEDKQRTRYYKLSTLIAGKR